VESRRGDTPEYSKSRDSIFRRLWRANTRGSTAVYPNDTSVRGGIQAPVKFQRGKLSAIIGHRNGIPESISIVRSFVIIIPDYETLFTAVLPSSPRIRGGIKIRIDTGLLEPVLSSPQQGKWEDWKTSLTPMYLADGNL